MTMCQAWMMASLVAMTTAEFTAQQYYQMPPIYELDDFEQCLTNPRGTFCLGSFDLHSGDNVALMSLIQEFSLEKCNFNHTQIRRGYCVSSRCPIEQETPLHLHFKNCVDNITHNRYGLATTLTQLDYCRTADQKTWRPVDSLDIAFAVLVALILIINLIGTVYDLKRSAQESKPNNCLLAWSLKMNWSRYTATYVDGDPRITALKPIHGVKAITLLMIILAHSGLMYHMTFVTNPVALERVCHNPLFIFIQNGTAIVQTFIMNSSFLLAYILLLRADSNPKDKLSLKMFPSCLILRITRILPAYIFVLGAATTWWSLSSDGPLWEPLVGSECVKCRVKWWTHLLFVNQLVKPDVKCLTHTWFLAVDIQLYVISAVLTLLLGGNPRRGLNVLAVLFVATILGNVLIAYFFELGSMLTLMIPRCIHVLFSGERSFLWLYQSPWNNLPCSLIGVFVAFLHYHLQKIGWSPKDCKWFGVVYRMSVPAIFLWVSLGYYMKDVSRGLLMAMYAAIDRAMLTGLVAIVEFGLFNQIHSEGPPGGWLRFLSWRGWAALDRMSLSVYLLHWLPALQLLAARPAPAVATVQEIGGHFLCTVLLTYVTALPLYLCVELPMMTFFRTMLS